MLGLENRKRDFLFCTFDNATYIKTPPIESIIRRRL